MRTRAISTLSALFITLGVMPANAMGYILWSAEDGKTSTYSQEISILSGNQNTAWKAQVRISSEMLFGIAVVQRSLGTFEAEFGTYFNQGVEPIATPGATCSYSGANNFQQNFSNCKISIPLTLPARVKLSINRDGTDLSGKTWVAYYTNMATGTENLISKFNVGQPNLFIQDIYEYAYPFGINECQVTQPIQESIWWRPTSIMGKYNFSSTNKSDCGTLQFITPQSYLKADGVVIKLNTPKTETIVYKDSLYEKLYPEVWSAAYAAGSLAASEEGAKSYLALQTSSETSVNQLQTQITSINDQVKKISAQLKKICGAKKKPAGC